MSIHPVWSRPEICSIVSTMMDDRKPVLEVSRAVFLQFGIRLEKNQITGYYYRSRNQPEAKAPAKPGPYDTRNPDIEALVAAGLPAKDIAARVGKPCRFVREYCRRYGLTLAPDAHSNEALRSATKLSAARLRAQEAISGASIASQKGVHFSERDHSCVWPLWSGRVPYEQKFVCGEKVIEPGYSYCPVHHRLAYPRGEARKQLEKEIGFAAKVIGRHVNADKQIYGEV